MLLCYFNQVGGWNALLPLLESLEEPIVCDGRTVVYSRIQEQGYPLLDWWEGVHTENIFELKKNMRHAIRRSLKEHSPSLIVTDSMDNTRAQDSVGVQLLWEEARHFNIPVIAYVDSWWAYKNRFFVEESSGCFMDKESLPTMIAVVDSVAEQEMIRLGFPSEIISVLGSPGFESLIRRKNQTLEKVPENVFSLVFVSQPFERILCRELDWGFHEKIVLQKLNNLLQSISPSLLKNIELSILLHPEEEEGEVQELLAKSPFPISTRVFHAKDSIEEILKADLVLGMVSILLVNAVVLEKPVVSLLPNLRQKDMLITNLVGATTPVIQDSEWDTHLLPALIDPDYRNQLLRQQSRFEAIPDGISRWQEAISQLV